MTDRADRVYIVLNAVFVKKRLLRHHVTYKKFAGEMGITLNYFYQLLVGYRRPSHDLCKKFTSHRIFRGKSWDDIFSIKESNV